MSDPESDTVEVQKVGETDKSYILEGANGQPKAYFPKSEVYFERINPETGCGFANIPNWLLDDRGW